VALAALVVIRSSIPLAEEAESEPISIANEHNQSTALVSTEAPELPNDSKSTRGTAFELGDSDRGQRMEPGDLAARVASLEDSLNKLGQQVEELAASVSQLPSGDDVHGWAGAAASHAESIHEGGLATAAIVEMAQSEQEAASRQFLESVENRFWSETVDPGWSSAAADALYEALSVETLKQSTLASLECRATLCRVELQDADPRAAELASVQLMARVGTSLSRAAIDVVDQGGGWTTTVIYLARQG
jgi:hypothetical protein